MDKLEKALEKARQQRNDAPPLASFSATTPLGSATPSTTTYPLSEEQLESNRILAHHTRSKEADVFRLLRTQVLHAMGKEKNRTLAITSSNYGEGKTTLALNLAISIASDMKQTVLLVDLDLRKPCIHKYLGIEPPCGLTDYLMGKTTIPDCLLRLPFERLSVLPAGNILDNSSEVLGSPKMAALARELKSRYPDRLIIYDMPPLLAQDDPLAFLPHVDAVLMVVQEGKTKQDEIKRCLDMLHDANVVGTVLNDCV